MDPDAVYKILDNGGVAFTVVPSVMERGGIDVFQNVWVNGHGKSRRILTISRFEELLVGDDVGGDDPEDDGNSLLVKISKHEYVYIGSKIYSFETDEEIRDYTSMIGNSCVPYPIAFGDDFLYFMLEQELVMMDEFDDPSPENSDELYNDFLFSSRKLHKTAFSNVEVLAISEC